MGNPYRGNLLPDNVLDPELLERLYIDEEMPEYKVAEKLGVCRPIVAKNLLHHGIPRRSPSEANVLRFKNSAAERRRAARHCKRIMTGRKWPVAVLKKKARTVYENQSQLSRHERAVRDRLQKAGIPAETLWPVERFNIDVAIPSVKLAVEIHGGWHHSKKKRDADRRKAALLKKRGWELLVFQRNDLDKASRRTHFVDHIVGETVARYNDITG